MSGGKFSGLMWNDMKRLRFGNVLHELSKHSTFLLKLRRDVVIVSLIDTNVVLITIDKRVFPKVGLVNMCKGIMGFNHLLLILCSQRGAIVKQKAQCAV